MEVIKLHKLDLVPTAVVHVRPPLVLQDNYDVLTMLQDSTLGIETSLYFGKGKIKGRLELFPTKKSERLYRHIKRVGSIPILPFDIKERDEQMILKFKELKDEDSIIRFCNDIMYECPYETYFLVPDKTNEVNVEVRAVKIRLSWIEEYDETDLDLITRVQLKMSSGDAETCLVATYFRGELIKMKLVY